MEIPGYQIIEEIGRGGMATVYLAVQESFGRKVALKVLDANAADDHDFAQRFLREAKIVSQLSHPHIVPVYDVGQQQNRYYMSMDLLAGGSLPEKIKEGIQKEDVVTIIAQIASALQCLHDHGYVHRDIKPDNILFRADGSAVLTDFGIARSQNSSEGLTQVGTIIGTPTYMSPEQINGGEVDGRADIYSLGIVLYHMLMGEPPYHSSDFLAVAVMHLQEPIPDLTLPYEEFQDVINKSLAKNVEDRYQSGNELIEAINRVLEQETPSNSAPTQLNEIPQPAKTTTPDEPIVGKPVEPAASPKVQIAVVEEGVRFEESMRKKFGLIKRYSLLCELAVRDAQVFPILFGRITTHIVEWNDEKEGKAEAIHIVFYLSEWIFKRAKHSVREVFESGGTFEFLKHLDVTVTLNDIEGEMVESYKLE